MTSLKYKNNQSVLVVIYAESTNRILMLQRQDDSTFWQSVTGTLETNETPRETAIREVWEEVGLKIEENSTALWQWLQEGAYFYVCGDASKMAKDVEQALLEVIAKEGNLSPDEAEDYLNELREEKRYQRDVY